MADERIIAGESTFSEHGKGKIGAESDHGKNSEVQDKGNTLKERISAIDHTKGLPRLPENFDDEDGDWIIIKSKNPFEILYLDYKQYLLISHEAVKQNFQVLEHFWRNKFELMNTGGNRVAFKNKYGDGVVENSLLTLRKAFERLQTKEGILSYFTEINNVRLRKGEDELQSNIEHMILDEIADKKEIEFCLEKGKKLDLTEDEVSDIILRAIEKQSFKPYGNVAGNTSKEKLLSVESWMTQKKINETEARNKELESAKVQILPGKYASTLEEIGKILYDDPKEAIEIIKGNFLITPVNQKDIVTARQIQSITENTKDLSHAFLKIVYSLNPNLPFPFQDKHAKTIKQLCNFIDEDENCRKRGKEIFKKGYIETWLHYNKTNDLEAYRKLLRIRDTAENIDLALLEFIYTFSPDRPYRFAGKYEVTDPKQLLVEIIQTKENWEAAKKELFSGAIVVWLKTTGKSTIVDKWTAVKDKYSKRKDIGLEFFLHLINESLPIPEICCDKESISFSKLESGKTITTELSLENKTRGAVQVDLSFSKSLPGVSLSPSSLLLNNLEGSSYATMILTIDSKKLLKGPVYETLIKIETSEGQSIELPLTFSITFPTTFFIKEVLKYSGLFAVTFILLRLVLSIEYKAPLNQSFKQFIDWRTAVNAKGDYSVFGWYFLLFGLLIFLTIILVRKLFKRYGKE